MNISPEIMFSATFKQLDAIDLLVVSSRLFASILFQTDFGQNVVKEGRGSEHEDCHGTFKIPRVLKI